MKSYLSLVKFSHTIFAMPFALVGFTTGLYAKNFIHPRWYILFFLVLICMVTARNAAMAFNRYLDRNIDANNPRTAIREIPKGIVQPKHALIFVVLNCIIFVVATFFINSLCFYLSPIALLVILGYSYTKKFTFLCHIVLGIGLSLAPLGAYLAVTGSFHWLPIVLGLSVLLWVAGFDIIYALQDESFDKTNQLYSIPQFFGAKKALFISKCLHLLSAVCLFVFVFSLHGYDFKWLGFLFFIGILVYQHYIINRFGLEKIDIAFFTTNGIGSLIFGFITILALLPWERF
jgi:4-hydroxybenzoate polyprenyltransferase